MQKLYLILTALFLVSTVFALPEAAKKQEEAMVRQSIQTLEKHGLQIIPTPKEIKLGKHDRQVQCSDISKKVIVVSSKEYQVASDWITSRLKKLSGIVPEVITPETWQSRKGQVAIIIQGPDKTETVSDLPRKPQGYAIRTESTGDSSTYKLIGHDYVGTLYSAVTFAATLKTSNKRVIFPELTVNDWPDLLIREVGTLEWPFRRRFWFKWDRDATYGKRYIDWCFSHKINWIRGVAINDPYAAIGDPRFRTAAMKKWLLEVNTYAKERGVKTVLPQSYAVGATKLDKDKPEFADCLDHRGGLYSWGDNALLDAKVAALEKFIAETGYSAVSFHSLDARNTGWGKRGKLDRKKFGDDRIAGDINVVNHLYKLKKTYPDLDIILIGRPYHGNLNFPQGLINKGELKTADDMVRFGRNIPDDIYLCIRECNRDTYDSWKEKTGQPLNLYVSYDRSVVFLSGRLLRPTFRFSRSWFEPGTNDSLYGCSANDLNALGGVEYSWNLYAPGSAVWDSANAYTSSDNVDSNKNPISKQQYKNLYLPQFDVMTYADNAPDFKHFIKRACKAMYGIDAGPFFEKQYLLPIDADYVFKHKETLRRWKHLKPYILNNAEERQAYMERIYRDSTAAIRELEAVFNGSNFSRDQKAWAAWFLSLLYPVNTGAKALSYAMAADLASRNKEFSKANHDLEIAINSLQTDKARLKKLWPSLRATRPYKAVYPFSGIDRKLKSVASWVQLLAVKTKSREERYKNRNAPVAKTQKSTISRPINVAVYDPQPHGGKAFGTEGLYLTLRSQLDFNVSKLDKLTPQTLKDIDCLVMPDCKSFGSEPVKLSTLRDFVCKDGKGIFLEHDSCGYTRFPFQSSIFPELAEVKDRIGFPVKHPHYNPKHRDIVVSAKHPITSGNQLNFSFKNNFFDHFKLTPTEFVTVLLKDADGDAVMIAGESGKGRVVFSGLLTTDIAGKPLTQPLDTVEGEMIVNAVHWLSRSAGLQLDLANLTKSDRVEPDGTYSFIEFTPTIKTVKPLTNVTLSAICQYPSTLKPIDKKVILAKIPELKREWSPEEALLVQVPEEKVIRMTICIQADQGKKKKSYILK